MVLRREWEWLTGIVSRDSTGTTVQILFWVAVKELKLSYHIGETLLFTTYTHYGNLI